MPKLLVIDDDRSVGHFVEHVFKQTDIRVVLAATPEAGMNVVETERPDVVLLDIVLPEISGIELFQKIAAIDKRLPVIFITIGGTSDDAITAMMQGAFDYLLKPLDASQLRRLVVKAIEARRITSVRVSMPAETRGTCHRDDELVGRSPRMLEVYKAVAQVAAQDITVLIRGESGTGKELVARAVYQHSLRKDGPFLAVNCAAMTETLLESELFGHEKGAFTGADRRRIGKFEQCNGGTIFLDEVGDMSPVVQSKVLRLLQDQRFERVGSNETIETNVRIVSATNRDLDMMCKSGGFRSDLYYRLNGFTIELPPLRERGPDILLLLEHFMTKFRRELNKSEVEEISTDAMAFLLDYTWPGNVREMQSVIRRVLLHATGSVIFPEYLPAEILGKASLPADSEHHGLPDSDLQHFVDRRLLAGSTELYAEALEVVERYLMARILRETGGNQSHAAKILGITRGKIRDRIAAFGFLLETDVTMKERID